jgi:hypothetical protein
MPTLGDVDGLWLFSSSGTPGNSIIIEVGLEKNEGEFCARKKSW